jgi:hypothetical protein
MKKSFAAFIAVIALVVMIFVSWNWPGWRDAAHPENSVWLAQLAWLIVAVCLIVFLMSVSAGITTKPLGFLINERNLMSLTRFQTVLWTVIILSAYFVVAIARIVMKNKTPLEILVDRNLWALLGISLTSLVGTSLINSTKTNKTTDNAESTKTARVLVASGNLPAAAAQAANQAADGVVMPAAAETDPGAANKAANAVADAKADSVATVIDDHKQGTLYANPNINDASLSDMFEGDEVGNAGYIDLAKVQMFFFTIIVGLSYVFLVLSETMAKLATDSENVTALPVLSAGMIALLGISHAGHLAGKTADRTKLQS